jgi:hypothetical protein
MQPPSLTLVYETFHRSQSSYLRYLKIAERRALVVTPAYADAWKNILSLQRLLLEQRKWCFEYLFARNEFKGTVLESIDRISERLEKDWSEAEETALHDAVEPYRDISQKIADISASWKPHTMDDASPTLEADEQYRKARLALAARTQDLVTRYKNRK